MAKEYKGFLNIIFTMVNGKTISITAMGYYATLIKLTVAIGKMVINMEKDYLYRNQKLFEGNGRMVR